MSAPARDPVRGRPRLTVVQGTRAPVTQDAAADWRRVAGAVLACTQELTQHILEQRWGRVDEALRERRELLGWFARLPLDAEGRRSLRALREATEESEVAIAGMLRARAGRQ
jgi:hypothetical protein